MIGQTIRSLPLRWNSHPCFERNGARSLFSWMAGRSRLPFEFHPIPLLLSRESATNALRDRFAFWPVLADHGRLKKKKGKKKRKSITIRWNSSVGANCPRQESSFAQRCAMKPYSPLRRPVFYRSECRFANVTVQMRTTTFCSFIVLSRLREKERERGKKKERKEFDKIFESESFDSPDADLRDTGSRLLSLFERLVAVVT